jgi:succinate dehydrogenase / fumarate reductase membrane anchor subunit
MSRPRPLGSAHRGVPAFLIQRLTSLYLGGFTVYLIAYLIARPMTDYQSWAAYFAAASVRLAWGIFFASLLAHAWVGLRSIYMDYLKPMWLRFTVSTVTAFGLIALAIWAGQILSRGAA